MNVDRCVFCLAFFFFLFEMKINEQMRKIFLSFHRTMVRRCFQRFLLEPFRFDGEFERRSRSDGDRFRREFDFC